MTAEELEKMFGITPERIDEIDRKAAAGILEGEATSTVTGPGRPPLYGEPMQQVSFKEAAATVQAIDRRARSLGMRRSEYLRQLVANDLACAGPD